MNQRVTPSDLKVLWRDTGVFEAPRWDGADALYFANVTAGGVHRLDLRSGTVQCVVPHRRGIGGFALTERGDFVVSGRNIALKRAGYDATEILFSSDGLDMPVIGFNDLAVDNSGRLVVGALGPGALNPKTLTGREPAPATGAGTGAVYYQAVQGWRQVADDIGHPNGIGFSTDGCLAYVSDSLRRIVYRFVVGASGWSERIEFARFEQGLPDGVAVASDDSVWVASALAGELVVLEPDGSIRTRYIMPTHLTTSVSFGGDDLRTVFVTAGSHDGTDPALVASFRSPVAGRTMQRALDFMQRQ